MIQFDTDKLGALAAKLQPDRETSAIANDLYEAAMDWRNLGETLTENKGYELSGRVEQEIDLLQLLQRHYGTQLDQNPDYRQIMEAGSRIIAAGKAYRPPPDGYLGSYRIVRDTFAFLQTEFGLRPGNDLDTLWDYASPTVCVYLSFPNYAGSACSLGRPSGKGSGDYDLEDLLFMGGKPASVSLALPPGEKIRTEADVRAWFATVAAVLRDYGADVLADRPGAFDRLAAAAAEKGRLYVEECDRLYGPGAQAGGGGTTPAG